MLRKNREAIVIILCLIIVIYGIISVNANLYGTLLKDKNNKMVLEQINEDAAFIKIFRGIDEKSDIYKDLSPMNSKCLCVFANFSPMNVRVESNKYVVYISGDTFRNYDSAILFIFSRIKSAFLKSISYITSY